MEMMMPGKDISKDFRPKNQSLSRQIADRIQQMVMDGELSPGDRLPSERNLADQLQVSRNMIREAAVLLEERGIVTIQTGSGVYIAEVNPNAVTRTLSVYAQRKKVTVAQIFEVRWALEIDNARLAASNALPEQIESLRRTIIDMESTKDDLKTFTKIDIRFHSLLAEASQNPIFPVLLGTITDLLLEQAMLATALNDGPDFALTHHRNIFSAIEQRDQDAARHAMTKHLEGGWERLLRVVKNPDEAIGEMRLLNGGTDDA
jgi:GntR family transcriptional repressor for pyruvate dehydrogenase complex